MAISYRLQLATDTTPETVVVAAAAGAGIGPVTPEQTTVRLFKASGEGLWLYGSANDAMSQMISREDYGVDATVSLVMRLDKFDLPGAQRRMLLAVSGALSGCAGDVVLLFNGERPVLRRRDGEVVFDTDFGVWTPDLLAVSDLPYRLGSMYL